MTEETVKISISDNKTVSGILSIPDSGPGETGVIIAHGAGNDMNYPLLAALAAGLVDAGHSTLRFNFYYREMGKSSLDNLELLHLAWLEAYRFFAEHPRYRPKRILAAGKSMGGRIAAQLAAEGRLEVEGLIFLGYPLHAPGKKERLRDGDLYIISKPMLFFAGTKDQLCDLELLKQVLSKLVAPWELEVIEGGDHSFEVPKYYAIDPTEVYEQIVCRTVEWLGK
jgi:hypothetical protein